ncbi:FmdB family zinc ribbon protein [Desulforhopalus singaporensis]|uniref:Putative regulatory protein, FmdB family n=1 Tax=Desulforhopalus singaporensis TaxID=91360 RepID=A0A1H0QP32_9BACT|nr:zinc ribbon domain-containing protein [Desulforhopalus singaporensis]SDP19094.1 putative regulatory protein, FmdB family [Desulforhopalus singaporensis]
MPIYEFYCEPCNTVFNFLSLRVNTSKIPSCPRCGQQKMTRQLSTFAAITGAEKEGRGIAPELDETRMERAFESLMSEAEHMKEDDPRQMASLMRKFTSETGLRLGDSMEEAISRMESGEDPDRVEKEMENRLGDEDFYIATMQKSPGKKRTAPLHDEKLYKLE